MAGCHLLAGTDDFSDRPCETEAGEACPGDGTCDDFAVCTCLNGRLDEGEADIDCGGRCAPDRLCPAEATCGTDDLEPSAQACASGVCCRCAGEFLCKDTSCLDAACEELPN